MKTDILKERIALYEGFIKNKKVPPTGYYLDAVTKMKNLLVVLKDNKMTPEMFEKLNTRDKWDVSKYLKNVTWLCNKCKSDQGEKAPESLFMGERECNTCYNTLTYRTNGGQSDPFNYTFKAKTT